MRLRGSHKLEQWRGRRWQLGCEAAAFTHIFHHASAFYFFFFFQCNFASVSVSCIYAFFFFFFLPHYSCSVSLLNFSGAKQHHLPFIWGGILMPANPNTTRVDADCTGKSAHWEHHLWFHRDTGVRASASSLKWCVFSWGKQMRAGYNYKRDLNQIRLKWHGLVNAARQGAVDSTHSSTPAAVAVAAAGGGGGGGGGNNESTSTSLLDFFCQLTHITLLAVKSPWADSKM